MYNNITWETRLIIFLIIFVVILLISVLFIRVFFPSLISSLQSQSSHHDNRLDKDAAWAMTEHIVKQQLVSPKTAKFNPYKERKIKYLGDYKWECEGYVDSQNTFGAMIRTKFKVTFRLTDPDGYAADQIEYKVIK